MHSNISIAHARLHKRGFTLTEIAIVLGIIGTILGAIWVAAAAAYTNVKTTKMVHDIDISDNHVFLWRENGI